MESPRMERRASTLKTLDEESMAAIRGGLAARRTRTSSRTVSPYSPDDTSYHTGPTPFGGDPPDE